MIFSEIPSFLVKEKKLSKACPVVIHNNKSGPDLTRKFIRMDVKIRFFLPANQFARWAKD